MAKRALILVDIQNGFCPGGNLAVKDGHEVVDRANRLIEAFQKAGQIVVATQDWHPQNHGSFASNHTGKKPFEVTDLFGLQQVLWPDHCVQGTRDAEFHPRLNTNAVQTVFRKGMDPKVDSYSGFYDNAKRNDTGLAAYLRGRGVTRVYVVGLATDYCVKFTALDAIDERFQTYVVPEACRGVNLTPGDDARALDEIRSAGGHIVGIEQAVISIAP